MNSYDFGRSGLRLFIPQRKLDQWVDWTAETFRLRAARGVI